MDNKVVAGNVSLYPDDWAVIKQVAKETGQRSKSGGLRALIADYVRLKAREVGIVSGTDARQSISQEM